MPAIIFAIDSLLGGGAEKVVLTLAEGFVEKGYTSHIITFEYGCDHALPTGVNLHVIDKIGCEKKGARLLITLASLFDERVRDIEKQEKEILGVVSNLTFTDRVLQHSSFPRILFCVHSHLFNYWKINQGNFFRRFKRLWKLRKLYSNKHLVCVSQGVATDLKDLKVKAASIRTIYNPFDIQGIRALAEETCTSQALGNYVISVGRFKQVKRHDRLLRAFAKADAPVKLLLLGKGTAEQETALKAQVLQHGLKEKVVFEDFIPNPYPFIKHARALLLSSDFEGLPTVIIESLICGTPVVSTDCPSGPQEILTGDQARFLVPVQDEELFAQKIREVLNSPPNLDEVNLSRFNKEDIVSQYEHVLRSL